MSLSGNSTYLLPLFLPQTTPLGEEGTSGLLSTYCVQDPLLRSFYYIHPIPLLGCKDYYSRGGTRTQERVRAVPNIPSSLVMDLGFRLTPIQQTHIRASKASFCALEALPRPSSTHRDLYYDTCGSAPAGLGKHLSMSTD